MRRARAGGAYAASANATGVNAADTGAAGADAACYNYPDIEPLDSNPEAPMDSCRRARWSLLAAFLLLAFLPLPRFATGPGGATPAGADTRVPRTFAEKEPALRFPLWTAPRTLPQPAALRRAVLDKALVDLEPRAGQRRDRFVVKFAEGLRVRLRSGALVELSGAPLPGVDAARALPGVSGVAPLFSRAEADLDSDRDYAMARSGAALADLNNYYLVALAPGADSASQARAWLALDAVETVYFEGIPAVACTDILPVTPSFTAQQTYLAPAPAGVDAAAAWAFDPAGRGVADYWFVDVENGWNVNHEDFGDVAILNPPSNPDNNHGTAVLGEIVGCDGPFGVTGIANGITARMVNGGNAGSVAAAFDLAASVLEPGEMYLIEYHMQGPPSGLTCQCNCGQFEYVPMEWDQANFDAIQTHCAAGIIVVEAGGNGSMNLDGPQYHGLFNRALRDSGAIMVGAGTPGAHAPECWTNHGSRIDCQGFGSSVVTAGYGGLHNPGDPNQLYTGTFSGTSSASPIVTGAAAVVQNLCQQRFGLTIDPATLRAIFLLYGTPQGEPLTKPIGKLPDLGEIIDVLYAVAFQHVPLPDTTDETNPYPVVAAVTPALLPEVVNGVTLHYSVSGGPYLTTAMTPTGNPDEWEGAIPAQSAGSAISYYLVADPANGPDVSFPAGGASDPLLFIVGTMSPVVSDELESPAGWTAGVAGDDATSGLWVHGDPYGTVIGSVVVAPEDDHTPAPGTRAFVTGNPGPGASPFEGDVDGGRTTLLSPLYDLSDETYVRISTWIWSRNPGDDSLRIDVSNDAGTTWHPFARIAADEPAWRFLKQELRREELPYTSAMQLRFVASDYGQQTLVEAGVDDLVIEGLRGGSAGVAPLAPVAPPRLALGPATPNPFAGSTAVDAFLPSPGGPVRLGVYDVDGRLVRVLLDGAAAAGRASITWDGRNTAGRPVAPGVYWLRLTTPSGEQSVRAVKLP